MSSPQVNRLVIYLVQNNTISENYRQLCYKRNSHTAIKVAARAHSNVVLYFCLWSIEV